MCLLFLYKPIYLAIITLQMYDQEQKQKFVMTLVQNVDYFNKDLTIKHINQFLKYHNQFTPRQAFRELKNGQFVSFVEMTGFVQIDRSHLQMYIGITIKYPIAAPVFLLAIDRNNFFVNQQQKLLQAGLIGLQKNDKNQDFIRLQFPILNKQWDPRNLSISAAFNTIMQAINRPPIVKLKRQQKLINPNVYQPNNYNSPYNSDGGVNIMNNPTRLKRINSKQVNEVATKIYGDIVQLISSKQNLQDETQVLDYNQCRQMFLKEHLFNLKLKISNLRKTVETSSEELRNNFKEVEESGRCNKLFEEVTTQSEKLQLLSQQQALKEAEVKLRSKIQKNYNVRFSDYKKTMKALYDKMFQNQTRVLKSMR